MQSIALIDSLAWRGQRKFVVAVMHGCTSDIRSMYNAVLDMLCDHYHNDEERLEEFKKLAIEVVDTILTGKNFWLDEQYCFELLDF